MIFLIDQQIDELLLSLGFDSMKNNVAVNYEPFFEDNHFKNKFKVIFFGDYVNIMSDKIIKKTLTNALLNMIQTYLIT